MFYFQHEMSQVKWWLLFCLNEAPGLHKVHKAEFEVLYKKYEQEGKQCKTIPAQKLWYAILEAQMETGGPFMQYKVCANGTYFLLSLCR
jgi:ribonucleoside-diphosphate reductase subunit M1